MHRIRDQTGVRYVSVLAESRQALKSAVLKCLPAQDPCMLEDGSSSTYSISGLLEGPLCLVKSFMPAVLDPFDLLVQTNMPLLLGA